jgi:hypothetical protein
MGTPATPDPLVGGVHTGLWLRYLAETGDSRNPSTGRERCPDDLVTAAITALRAAVPRHPAFFAALLDGGVDPWERPAREALTRPLPTTSYPIARAQWARRRLLGYFGESLDAILVSDNTVAQVSATLDVAVHLMTAVAAVSEAQLVTACREVMGRAATVADEFWDAIAAERMTLGLEVWAEACVWVEAAWRAHRRVSDLDTLKRDVCRVVLGV